MSDKPSMLIERCNPDLGNGRPLERELMMAAWASFLKFSGCHDATLSAYKADTGKDFMASLKPRSPIERMIDKAAGFDHAEHQEAAFLDFAEWVTRTVWGRADQVDLPKAAQLMPFTGTNRRTANRGDAE